MAKKLWGGRFSKKTDPLVEEFTKSIDYDYKLAWWDIGSSVMHVNVLEKTKFLEPAEAKKLKNALFELLNKVDKGTFKFNSKCEDIHTNIQNEIQKGVGDLVFKLHTARSRNDQIAFDMRLFCKSELLGISASTAKVQIALLEMCKKDGKIIIPGYTHLQHAQLVYLSDFLQGYAKMFGRDSERLTNLSREIKVSLGAGALAGTPIKPEVYENAIKEFVKDHKKHAKVLDIEQDITISTALDTVSDRDFVIETLSALAILGMHLSRLAEDLIIWSTKEFGFVEIDDAFATGSSLMPQKKNPDVLELIRGHTGTLYGNLMSVLTMMKGLPLSYNRDMQLDKPPLFSSFEIVEKELKVLPKLIETLTWDDKAIRDNIEKDETLYATDFVYYLIKKGIPFKEAHDIIGKLIKFSIDNKVKIKEMTDGTLKQFSDKLRHKEIVELMDPIRSVKSRVSVDRSKKA